MRIGLFLYRILTRMIAPALPYVMRRRAARGKENPETLPQRFARSLPARPNGSLIWMHGASVGESKLLLLLADALQQYTPDVTILHTCQTLTGAALIKGVIADKPNRLFTPAPLDTLGTAKRFADHWQPDLAIFAEGEIWPNLLTTIRKAGSKTALINARMTQKSLSNWARWPGTAQAIFGDFDIIAASDPATATALQRFAPQASPLPANLKTALPPLKSNSSELSAFEKVIGNRSVLLAASTHPGEETLVLEAIAQMETPPFLIMVPRHPERGNEVEQLCHTRGYRVNRRSKQTSMTPEAQILLADTMGEMGLWIQLADTVYLGGGHCSDIGGHNPLEAIRLRKPVLTGPDVFNFTAMMKDLEQRGGLYFVSDAKALANAIPAPPPSEALLAHLETTAQEPLNAALKSLLPLLPGEGEG